MRFAKKTRVLGPVLSWLQKGVASAGAQGAQLAGRNTARLRGPSSKLLLGGASLTTVAALSPLYHYPVLLSSLQSPSENLVISPPLRTPWARAVTAVLVA